MLRERQVPAIRAAPLPFQPSGFTFHRRGGRTHCFQYRLCVLLHYALSSPLEVIFALTTEYRALQSHCSRSCFSPRVFLLHAIFPATLTAFSPLVAIPLVPYNGWPLSISIRSPERARHWPARSPMLESYPVSGHYPSGPNFDMSAELRMLLGKLHKRYCFSQSISAHQLTPVA